MGTKMQSTSHPALLEKMGTTMLSARKIFKEKFLPVDREALPMKRPVVAASMLKIMTSKNVQGSLLMTTKLGKRDGRTKFISKGGGLVSPPAPTPCIRRRHEEATRSRSRACCVSVVANAHCIPCDALGRSAIFLLNFCRSSMQTSWRSMRRGSFRPSPASLSSPARNTSQYSFWTPFSFRFRQVSTATFVTRFRLARRN